MKTIKVARFMARVVGMGCVVASAWALVACGGGGSSTPTAPNTDPGYASLVPAAPALGAVIEADAGVLVPMTHGARWTFWGRQANAAGGEVARYQSNYQWEQSGSEWLLKGSNPGNDGPDQSRYVFSSGELRQIESVTFLQGQPAEDIRMTVLRSPVRAGDQVVAFNKRLTGFPDQDADGRTESLDIAVYTRVVGRENITLATGDVVDAVRVETHLLQRLLLSKTATPGPVQEVVLVEWLARGLGWVAREQPTFMADGQVRKSTEVLFNAELGDHGYGATGPTTLLNPATSPEQPGQVLDLRSPELVAAGANGVLLAGDPTVPDYSGRRLLTLLNTKGEVQWTRWGPVGGLRGAALGSGWAMWGYPDTTAVVTRLDAQGAPLASAQTLDMGGPTSPLPSTHRNLQIASDGQTLWVAGIRADWVNRPAGGLGPRDGVVVRGFDANGTPRTAAVLLEQSDQDGFMGGSPSLAVSNGNAYVTWTSGNGGQAHVMTVKIDASGATTAAPPRVDGVTSSTTAQIVGAPTGLLLNWGYDNRFAWLDANLGASLLDSTRSDGTLPAWSAGEVSENLVRRGDLLLRWGVEPDSNIGAPDGVSGDLLRWQLYRAGQPAPVRRHLVSGSLRTSGALVVPLADRLLLITRPRSAPESSWVANTVWY